MAEGTRFRLTRCGVINVWQYDRQVFDLSDGRLLLRGANGAGKSKTMEMLMPFAIDGDKARLTASGRHHTSLLWLLLDGHEGGARTGYVWVEFARTTADGDDETITCGVGMRATQSARSATSWFFTSPRRVGADLHLEDESGPLSRQQLDLEVTRDGEGQVFDQTTKYREHVGQRLFGLPPDQYDDLLRLIYWLRQPQVGEDIDPKRLAEQLVNALPQVDEAALRTAGDTFDELEAFGEQLERRARAAQALGRFVDTYAAYTRCVVHERGSSVIEADSRLRGLERDVRRIDRELAEATEARGATAEALGSARAHLAHGEAAIGALESGPEARARSRLLEMSRTVEALAGAAEAAGRHRSSATERADNSAGVADAEARAVSSAASRLADDLVVAARQLEDAGADGEAEALAGSMRLARAGDELRWVEPASEGGIEDALPAAHGWVEAASASVTRRGAALTVVRAALGSAEDARQRATASGEREEEAQGRVEHARGLLDEAARAVEASETAFTAALAQWHSSDDGFTLELPMLDPEGLGRLDALSREAAAPRLEELSAVIGRADHDADTAAGRRGELVAERALVAAQVDPEPPPPLRRHDARDGLNGAPFWRLVDFADTLSATERAGLEAALDGAGVLDAWVWPDGRVQGDRLDVQLVVPLDAPGEQQTSSDDRGGRAGGATLASVLRVDPEASAVPAPVVTAVLGLVAVAPATEPEVPGTGRPVVNGPDLEGMAVSTDGSWRVGPVHGRTTKGTAQFVGAAARAAERRRRLDLLDEQIAEADGRFDDARARARAARADLERVHLWLAARPSHDGILRAWATHDERGTTSDRLVAEHVELASVARERRAEAASRHDELVAVAATHRLPTTGDGLRARDEELKALASGLATLSRAATELAQGVRRWGAFARAAREDAAALAVVTAEAEATTREWTSRRDEHAVLVEAEGASVAELESRLGALRHEVESHQRRVSELARAHEGLVAAVGGLTATLEAATGRVARARPEVEVARGALAALDDLPGLTASAFAETPTPDLSGDDARAVAPSRESDAEREQASRSGRLATISVTELRRLVATLDVRTGIDTARTEVLASVTELQSGEAAIHEPRLLDQGNVLVALGREDAGDLPLVELHQRVSAAVATDRELLTARERKLFEDHVLGQLGDALRSVRRKADELVHAMNDQLRDVTTSQGIRVRLRWRLRDDIASEARRAVELIAQPIGALLPDERTELRESLHRLIDVSRAEAPEEPYAWHLARALDYRQWNAFTVQYHRPETGDWRDLQRRTALSQGEQKVLCYLPLFAAAAAHFTSVAGAAPHAPRFVLLDDAFPKIDTRTHPLLFGLLVDLDLDFVITSERLWGTHSTVPRLAIYEALRSPGERGIAQFQHRWDGHQLTAVGAGG